MKTGRDAVRDGRDLMENDGWGLRVLWAGPAGSAYDTPEEAEAALAAAVAVYAGIARRPWPGYVPEHPNYREQRVGDETA